jgi:hypothetical protein
MVDNSCYLKALHTPSCQIPTILYDIASVSHSWQSGHWGMQPAAVKRVGRLEISGNPKCRLRSTCVADVDNNHNVAGKVMCVGFLFQGFEAE